MGRFGRTSCKVCGGSFKGDLMKGDRFCPECLTEPECLEFIRGQIGDEAYFRLMTVVKEGGRPIVMVDGQSGYTVERG